MKLVFLDTETTDKCPGQICQLTYVIYDTNKDLKDEKIKGKNFFFSVDYVAEGALKTHGFSVEDLKNLSGNLKFKDLYKLFKKDLFESDFIIGHNINFDISFLKKEFERCDLDFVPKNIFCTMNYFKNILKLKNSIGGIKAPKLSELLSFLKIEDNTVLENTKNLFTDENTTFHDARFDTVAVYLSIIKSIKLNLIDKGFFSSKLQ